VEGPFMGTAPVMPNASMVTGTVQTLKHEDQRPVLELLVQCADDVPDMANFVAEEIGNTIPIKINRHDQSKALPTPETHVRLRVEFRGDEWGGGYYANAEDVEPVSD
jgi:hypothetical protein